MLSDKDDMVLEVTPCETGDCKFRAKQSCTDGAVVRLTSNGANDEGVRLMHPLYRYRV